MVGITIKRKYIVFCTQNKQLRTACIALYSSICSLLFCHPVFPFACLSLHLSLIYHLFFSLHFLHVLYFPLHPSLIYLTLLSHTPSSFPLFPTLSFTCYFSLYTSLTSLTTSISPPLFCFYIPSSSTPKKQILSWNHW